MTSLSDPLIQPEVIPLHAASADPILLPDPATVFADRARRFEHFAATQPEQAAFFGFMTTLANAQEHATRSPRALGLPSAESLRTCHAHAMPVLPAGLGAEGAPWIDAVRAVVAHGAGAAAPAAAHDARRALEASDDDELERLGTALLAFDYASVPVDAVSWLAAGLQAHWTQSAAALGRDAVRPIDVATVCPCCGSLPVASVRRIDGLAQGLRYLVCSLCATQWHLVRIKCSHCESTEGLHYLTLSDDPDSEAGQKAASREVVKAEVCERCSSYLKFVSLESDPRADPVADDLATLALDVLTDARGYARIGPNLLIHPGSPEG